MTAARAVVRPFALPLRRPLATAHGPITRRLGYLVELRDEQGRSGFGEATPLPEFGTEALAACRAALMRGLAGGRSWPDSALTSSDRERTPCAHAALDGARADLASRRDAQSLALWTRRRAGLEGEPLASVAVQALVGGEDPASVAESARAALASGYRAFKLKLAVCAAQRDLALDLERVAALREVVGPSARLRLDANEAWTPAAAAAALRDLERFGIDYVEQPVSRADLTGLAWLAREGAVAVAADEALQGDGLARCLAARAARVLVVKPAALGGLSACAALARRAEQEGLRVVWSTLIDGAVGRAGPLALAAALGAEDEVHGLGTADLLARDLDPDGRPDRPDARGRLPVSTAPGLGFTPAVPAAAGPGAAAESDDALRRHLESGFEASA